MTKKELMEKILKWERQEVQETKVIPTSAELKGLEFVGLNQKACPTCGTVIAIDDTDHVCPAE